MVGLRPSLWRSQLNAGTLGRPMSSIDLELRGVTWQGPSVDDESLLPDLPPELASLLAQINGFVLFGGCLHVRGAVADPRWHSLRRAWRDYEFAIPTLYRLPDDSGVPFAQDCVGDQFLLQGGLVWTLSAETGQIAPTSKTLFEFLTAASTDPEGMLQPAPLLQFQRDGGHLVPGHLLHVYPPFCTKESASGVSIKDVPCDELIRFHADFARQIAGVAEGGHVRVTIGE